MKENKVKAIGVLKIVLRIVNIMIFVASVIGIIQILMPKKKEVENTEEEPTDFDEYINDADLDDYEFPEEGSTEDLVEVDDSDDEDDDEDLDDEDDDDYEDEDTEDEDGDVEFPLDVDSEIAEHVQTLADELKSAKNCKEALDKLLKFKDDDETICKGGDDL